MGLLEFPVRIRDTNLSYDCDLITAFILFLFALVFILLHLRNVPVGILLVFVENICL